jgi:hypothetical protein
MKFAMIAAILAVAQTARGDPKTICAQQLPGHFQAPEGIAVDAKGTIYVAEDEGSGIIHRLKAGAHESTQWVTLPVRPKQGGLLGLAVDEEHQRLYVCAPYTDYGALFAVELGNPHHCWEVSHDLGFPNAIAFHGNEILVSDTGKALPGIIKGHIYALPRNAPREAMLQSRIVCELAAPNGLAVKGNNLFVAQTFTGIALSHGMIAQYRLDGNHAVLVSRHSLRGWPDGLLLDGNWLYIARQRDHVMERRDIHQPSAKGRALRLCGDEGLCAPASLALTRDHRYLFFTDIREPDGLRLFLSRYGIGPSPRAHHHVYLLPLAAFDQ